MKKLLGFGRSREPDRDALPPPPFEFHARGLEHVLESQRQNGGWRVLDLGPAHHDNLQFFAGRKASYTVEDVWGTIAPCRSVGAIKASCLRDLDDLLALESDTIDLVLAWDLFDYFDEACLEVLAERLSGPCRTGALVHSLIRRGDSLPARPMRHAIVTADTVRHPANEPPMTARAKHHTDPVLARCLAPFEVEKTFLLKHGVQEHIFELR